MPRANAGRTINVESSLARRIAYERDSRGWNNESLAQRMTDVGCSIHPSALHKIEKSNPPRRVTVNELVALAQVFELTVENLLQPVEALLTGRAKVAFSCWTKAAEENDRAHTHMQEAQSKLESLVAEHPGSRDAVEAAVRTWVRGQYGYDEREPVEAIMKQFLKPHASVPVDRAAMAAHRAQVEDS